MQNLPYKLKWLCVSQLKNCDKLLHVLQDSNYHTQ